MTARVVLAVAISRGSRGEAGAGGGDRLDGQGIADVIAARAARVDRDRDPHQTTSARFPHQVAGKLVVSVDLRRARSDGLVGESTNGVAKCLLVVGQFEAHRYR